MLEDHYKQDWKNILESIDKCVDKLKTAKKEDIKDMKSELRETFYNR